MYPRSNSKEEGNARMKVILRPVRVTMDAVANDK